MGHFYTVNRSGDTDSGSSFYSVTNAYQGFVLIRYKYSDCLGCTNVHDDVVFRNVT